MRKVSMHDIAAELGVSAMTVSNVINGKPCVAEETARKVLETAARLGFKKNAYASVNSIKKAQTERCRTVAFNAQRFMSGDNDEIHLYRDIYFGLMERLKDSGAELLLTGNSDAQSLAKLAMADVIVELDELKDEALTISKAPRVCVFAERPGCWNVLPDNDAAGRMAAELLISKYGFKRVAACFWGANVDHVQRSQSFLRHCAALAPDVQAESLQFDREGAFERLAQRPASLRPEALFAITGNMALVIFRRAQELGIEIPKDYSLLGFDDFPFYQWISLKISRLHFDQQDIVAGIHAAICGIFSGGTPAKTIVPIHFKAGDSLKVAKEEPHVVGL